MPFDSTIYQPNYKLVWPFGISAQSWSYHYHLAKIHAITLDNNDPKNQVARMKNDAVWVLEYKTKNFGSDST